MEKKRDKQSSEDILDEATIGYKSLIENDVWVPFDKALLAVNEYAAQETAPLQERIDELEGALKGMYSPLEVAAIAEAAYNTGSAVQEFNIKHYLKPKQ